MTTPHPGRPSFWQRRVRRPLARLLTQGLTPDRIAFTLGVGAACSLFPFLGFTTLLNLGVGLALGLNQPLLQTLNQLLGPAQLAMILVYLRLGEWIWRVEAAPFSVTALLASFRHASFPEFLAQFGRAGLHAGTAWLVTSPLLVLVVQWASRPALRRLASRRALQT